MLASAKQDQQQYCHPYPLIIGHRHGRAGGVPNLHMQQPAHQLGYGRNNDSTPIWNGLHAHGGLMVCTTIWNGLCMYPYLEWFGGPWPGYGRFTYAIT